MPTGVTFVLRTFLEPPECAEDELPEANGKSGFGPGVADVRRLLTGQKLEGELKAAVEELNAKKAAFTLATNDLAEAMRNLAGVLERCPKGEQLTVNDETGAIQQLPHRSAYACRFVIDKRPDIMREEGPSKSSVYRALSREV